MADKSEMKKQAIEYFHRNKVPLRMQDVLNLIFKTDPRDVNGFVSTYFEELSMTPTVSRVLAVSSVDSKGQPAITVKVFCISRNKEVLSAEAHVALDTKLPENAKVDEMDSEESNRQNEIEESINFVNNELRDIIVDTDPKYLEALDNKLYEFLESKRLKQLEQKENSDSNGGLSPSLAQEDDKKGSKKSGKVPSAKKKAPQVVIIPDKPIEQLYSGSLAITSMSQAIANSGAYLSKVPLYDHLMSCYGDDSYSIMLPLPIITLLQCGKGGTGKNKIIKEYMITSREDMTIEQAVSAAIKIGNIMMKTIYAKAGVTIKNLNDIGALSPVVDKVEQGLDMITDAVNQAGFEMGKDFYFVLNSSARDCFDYEKGKYEVLSGVLKGPDDMPDFWMDICNRYPAVIGLIDPIRSEEKEQWNQICSQLSDRCLIITENGYNRPGLLKDDSLDFSQFSTSGVVMKLEGCNTITDVVKCSKKMASMDNVVILACGQHDTNDTTIVDLSIACHARFIKLGAPARGERVQKYNHLIDIENLLGERKAIWPELKFPVIPPKPPTPLPSSPSQLESNQDSTKSDS